MIIPVETAPEAQNETVEQGNRQQHQRWHEKLRNIATLRSRNYGRIMLKAKSTAS
jgi:hypothetical protein